MLHESFGFFVCSLFRQPAYIYICIYIYMLFCVHVGGLDVLVGKNSDSLVVYMVLILFTL